MPGVPAEMKRMVADHIAPFLSDSLNLTKVHTKLLRTTGIPESRLYEQLAHVLEEYPEIQTAFLPRYIGVDMRFRLISDDPSKIARFNELINIVRQKAGPYIFTEGNEELEQVLNRLLTKGGFTLSVAESFTGGLLSNLLTDVPGSSAYFINGLITYSNQSKIDLLGVSPQTLKKHGAVSAATALEMVRGTQSRYTADCAIATTGIAGPGGATQTKPVGLCYVAARFKEKELVKEFHFGSDRLVNKQRGAVAGMEMLRRLLLE
jgi:nicotinamide-nucleotide amidase